MPAYLPAVEEVAWGDQKEGDAFDDISVDDSQDSTLRKEFVVFRKQTLKSIVTKNDAGELDFFGGGARRQDIDVLAFYRFWKNRIPLMTNIIFGDYIPIG
jgi:hypothetical protein